MKHRLFFFLVPVFLLISSCTLPLAQSALPSAVSVTPNMTMTALFASGVLGSLTPAAETQAAPSDTPVPTLPPADTSIPPTVTITNTPTPSDTPIPTQTLAVTMTPPSTLTPGSNYVFTNTPSGHYVYTNTPSGNHGSRAGTLFQAAYLHSAPTLDGSWDEWSNTAYPATAVVYGGGNWTGADDLEASFRVGWDENYLYLAVKVKDDVYVQNAKKADLYLGDSIELLLDTDLYGDFYWNQLSYDDYQLGISSGRPDVDGTREAYLWFPGSIEGSRSSVQIGSMRSDGVTRIEAAIPWSMFGVSPYAGQHFGFALSASDNDNTAENQQQSMVSSASNRHLLDPMTWGEIELVW